MIGSEGKMMKKIIAVLLACVMAFSCVACGNGNEKNTENIENTESTENTESIVNSETQESEDITSESEMTQSPEKPTPQIDYVSIDGGGTGVVDLI